MPGRETMPSTIERSPKKAQDIWVKVHDNAVKEYGEGRRAHMTAFAALKNEFEKVGDHWAPKGHKGPSDTRAASGHQAPKGRSKPRAAGAYSSRNSKPFANTVTHASQTRSS
jgi:hypothetical protein